MSNAITFQPNDLSARYSAGKISEEDLIKSDNEIEHQEQNNDNRESPENSKAGASQERITDYKEDTFCDYMVNICQCTSWLCANLVSSIVLCFENCIDFVHTCKCNNLCCDVCGGSEHSLEENNKVTDNERINDLSSTYEDDYVICTYTNDIEDVLPDSCVIVERHKTPEIDGEELKNMSNNQNQSEDSENNKKSWI